MLDDQLIETVENQASMRDLDLDDVQIVDDDSNARVVRVLYESGTSEADSIGFQVAKPDTPMGDQQFRRRLRNGLDELKSYVHGDTDDDTAGEVSAQSGPADETAPPSSTSTDAGAADTHQSAPPHTEMRSASAQSVLPSNEQPSPLGGDPVTLSVETQLQEDDRDALINALNGLVADVESIAELERDVRALEATVADLEARIEQYESVFAQLSATPQRPSTSDTDAETSSGSNESPAQQSGSHG